MWGDKSKAGARDSERAECLDSSEPDVVLELVGDCWWDSWEPRMSGSGEVEEEVCLEAEAAAEGCWEECRGMHQAGVDLAKVLGTWPLQASCVLRGERCTRGNGQRSQR